MKWNLPTWLCVIIALALVVFGMEFGTRMGFAQEREEVTQLLEQENGLMDVLAYRAADGLNLCVVAARHLSAADADLTELESTARRLQANAPLETRRSLDEQMTAAVAAVSAKLRASDSFLRSQRDQKYLEMLTADLNNLKSSAAVSTYNAAAQAYNAKLEQTLPGRLAVLLGADACALYQ